MTSTYSTNTLSRFDDLFSNYREAEAERGVYDFSRGALLKEGQAREVTLVPVLEAQRIIRPLYGKGDPRPPTFGDHPDYMHLKDRPAVEHGATSTLFVDIQGSTKLGLIHDLETVYQVKNALIRLAVDVVAAFDGHVHRIMGDAVMAYFGRRSGSVEEGAIDALNAAAVLRAIAVRSVKPQIEAMGLDEKDFGFRVGVDFGAEQDVLWGLYGLPGMCEVTATSFYVDAAAKLQQRAKKNRVMLGESVTSLLDYPQGLLVVPTRQRNGAIEARPFLTPNYLLPDGSPRNYRNYELASDEYLRCGPLGMAGLGTLRTPVSVAVSEHVDRNGPRVRWVTPSGDIIPKGRWLQFEFGISDRPAFPFKVRTKVTNHGTEAAEAEQLDREPVEYEVNHVVDWESLRHWESTKYRGLHYLDVEMVKAGVVTHSSRVGIYIE